jgi:hypothetical protein
MSKFFSPCIYIYTYIYIYLKLSSSSPSLSSVVVIVVVVVVAVVFLKLKVSHRRPVVSRPGTNSGSSRKVGKFGIMKEP